MPKQLFYNNNITYLQKMKTIVVYSEYQNQMYVILKYTKH